MYYHIRVKSKNYNEYKYVYDLNENKVKEISNHYNSSTEFNIGGLITNKTQISEFMIVETALSSDEWVENSYKKLPSGVLILIKKANIFTSIGNEASNVTDDYLQYQRGNINMGINLKKMFVVHGRNMDVTNEVKSFLESAGFDPIIDLDKNYNGNTVIEQIEEITNVDKAIIIYTPDDVGRIRKRYNKTKDKDKLFNRARQNVIFEHGYLCGKLGRENIIMILCNDKKRKFEKPSDVDGWLYIDYDKNGAWKDKLLKNLNSN